MGGQLHTRDGQAPSFFSKLLLAFTPVVALTKLFPLPHISPQADGAITSPRQPLFPGFEVGGRRCGALSSLVLCVASPPECNAGMLFEEVWSLSVLSSALPLLPPCGDWCFRPVPSQGLCGSFLAASGETLGSGLLTEFE